MNIEKYSFGIGDRFSHQGRAQLTAFKKAKERGLSIVPVWNKSKREHAIIGSSPADTRREADDAVAALGWKDSYYCDADHIGFKTVDEFIPYCDFYTIDVAESIGKAPDEADLEKFVKRASVFAGTLQVPGIAESFHITAAKLETIARKYLSAVKEASRIYKKIVAQKGEGNFITEVSFDENLEPQTPEELFFILLGLAEENIPIQTIAPKFTGHFHKGVDYIGDVSKFAKEFEDDVLVLRHAVRMFGLPDTLKLSVHSGSDKFSLYKPMYAILQKHDSGLHLKTAGTTWLEELIGLILSGPNGLAIARSVYRQTFERMEEMVKPYASVVDIDMSQIFSPDHIESVSADEYKDYLMHNQQCQKYNKHIRQMLHLGYKVAAEMNNTYTGALEEFGDVIGEQVTYNIYNRHILPLFFGE